MRVEFKSWGLPISGLSGCTVRVSKRARNVVLKVSVRGELEVVIPRGFDRGQIPEILCRRQLWIEKTVRKFRERSTDRNSALALPDRILLRAIGEGWTVQYCPTSAKRVSAVENGGAELEVRGNAGNEDANRLALKRWVTYKAYVHLIPWLRKVSEENGLFFVRALVKGQRTRWGSCSRQKTISINHKLLFLPADLVQHIFLHELCHTVHLNHSSAFWALLEDKQPGCKKLNADLRKAWQLVPAWLD